MMAYRPNIDGLGQALSCDKTTTGARLISSIPLSQVNILGFAVIRLGDQTTPCPKCGKAGRVAESARKTRSYMGINAAVDGCMVICSCPPGSNRIIAPLGWLGAGPSPEKVAREKQAALLVEQKAAEEKQLAETRERNRVFAKSCERGEGCTDAGEAQEPHTNFAPVGYFRAVPLPEPEQHAQAAKRGKPAPVAPATEKKAKPGWYTWLFGEEGNVAPAAAAVAVPASKIFPSGSAALEWLGGRFSTQGSWAIRAAAFGEIATAGVGAGIAAGFVGMMPGKLNEGEQDFIDKMRLSQVAKAKGTAPTRVRFAWEDAGNGRLVPKGYHTSAESGQDQVPVREMTFNSYSGNYEFTTDGPDAITIYWNPAKLDLEVPSHTGHQDDPYLPTTITVLPIPEKVGSDIEVYPAPEERSFRDYILILPIPDMPPIYIYLSKPPVEFLDVELYSDFERRSRQGKYEADHMPSAAAVREHLRRIDPYASTRQLEDMAKDVAAIVVPKEVHQKLSETYGGRNTPAQIDLDSRDLRAAVDRNLDAIKPALKEHGASDAQIEAARAKMHKLNSDVGLYK
jgi:pyocin large subunit-like protein/uncharacterized Zn-binding protein involved in type VI secretion